MPAATNQQDGPQPRRPPILLFKVLNPVMRVLLRSPLQGVVSDRLMLMKVTGRKTGRRYSIPVGYARVGDSLYSGTEGRWARNLRGGAQVEVLLKGERRRASAELITDVEGMAEAYRTIAAASPGYANALARSTGITFGPAGEVSRDEVVRAKAAGHVVVRTTLDQTG